MNPIMKLTFLLCHLSVTVQGFSITHNTGFSTHLQSTAIEDSLQTSNSNPRKVGLALQLDDGTRKSHSFAQNTSFVTSFFKGLSNRKSYSNLLTSLFYVYDAMEEVMDQTAEPNVKYMDDIALRRVPALSKDMEYFHGPHWKNTIQPTLATKKYVQRIRQVANDEPKLLIAHQYTRYLGDLFGGQMMGSMAKKSLNLKDREDTENATLGTAFYTFQDISNPSEFITKWYQKLNSLDLTEEEKMAIVDEANLVFDLNIQILEEIDGNAFSSFVTLLWKSLCERLGLE